MKTSLNFLIILVVGFSINAGAAIEGRWIGWADWSYDGQGTRCSANLAFGETSETFTFQKGFLDCEIVIMDIPERIFTKNNGQLLLEDAVVGKWNTGHYEWTERYNERTVIHVSITIEGSHMDYIEHWIQDENTKLYDIKGRLFREE